MNTNNYYFTDSLFINLNNRKFYLIDEDGTHLQINKNNFKESFSHYGWEDIDFLWELELGENYMLLDCGSNGDCLFHCISEALNLNKIYKSKIDQLDLYDVQSLRHIASDQVTDKNYDIIINSYKIEEELGEFQGDWSPNEIDSIETFKTELRKTGNNFWGDHIILQLLSEALKINFVILNSDDEFNQLTYNKVIIPGNKEYIILNFLNNCHYNLVGNFDGTKMNVVFKKIPKQMLNLGKV